MDILNKETSKTVSIIQKDRRLWMTTKREKMWLLIVPKILLPIDTFPTVKGFKPIPATFKDAVRITEGCAGRDDSFFILTTLHVTPRYVESFDAQRACMFVTKTGFKEDFLVKAESAKAILPLDITHAVVTKAWVCFKTKDGLVIGCRKYVEKFPSTDKRFIVSGQKVSLPGTLRVATERATIFASETADEVRVDISIQEGSVTIVGEGTTGRYERTDEFDYKGPPIKFGIPPAILLDQLKRHSEFYISGRKISAKGKNYIYVSAIATDNPKSKK
jgi:hypothetical protein